MKCCEICGGEYHAKNRCKRHYSELQRRRRGIPIKQKAKPKEPVQRIMDHPDTCEVDGCTNKWRAKGMCGSHYNKARGYAPKGPDRIGGTYKVVGYRGAHQRVTNAKGKASTYDCVCGKPAQEWALDPNAVHTYEDEQGRVWSMNVDDYKAMCCSCHRKLDKQPDDWYIELWLENK